MIKKRFLQGSGENRQIKNETCTPTPLAQALLLWNIPPSLFRYQQVRDVRWVQSLSSRSPCGDRTEGAGTLTGSMCKPCNLCPWSCSLTAWLPWVCRGGTEGRTHPRKGFISSGCQRLASCKKEMRGCKWWRVGWASKMGNRSQ